LILGATSAVMPMKYIEIMKQVDGVKEVAPVLNWLVAKIKGESKAVNLWAVDYPSFKAISGGFDIVSGRPLEQSGDLVMDTVLADATGMKVGDSLPMLNREFHVAGICRAGAGGRLYARIEDVQDAVGSPDKASFFLVKGRQASEAESLAKALQARFKGHKITPMAQVSKAMQDNAVGLKEFKQALTGMAVVISFLVVLLAMYTTIIERTREIGILRAMGTRRGQLLKVFLVQGAVLGFGGSALGAMAGYGLVWVFNTFGPKLFFIPVAPVLVPMAMAIATLTGTLAAAVPARRASNLDPVEAIRHV
jgi:lipoprotein-releasing system permease protein